MPETILVEKSLLSAGETLAVVVFTFCLLYLVFNACLCVVRLRQHYAQYDYLDDLDIEDETAV
ncbi:protein ORF15 [Cyprinid herpesvirus 3]|uniref:ORF15L n=1 Tax=Cyprinid herpesvirus 3 TaxID=180230 RepID=A3QMI7_CYHV3|nr:unnamed protein product [Cyprinid herpesvirus 3]ABF81798.1 hypothetical protein [Cyprinid herpesvirus 3]ABG42846.1 protein ORF15 [Cyprinid herpesvirus 3]AIC32370.1 ORF15L [Cyprinid herpesvirus 3]AJP55509.1 protein ORF15 [Cyprinid herpesvirus 3]AJP55666.1 protein ORF15 [Cyprinid herpesvirus 3]